MTEPTIEPPVSGNDDDDDLPGLNGALVNFTGCIGEAFPDICSYGLTYGAAYVPFAPDPDDELCDEDEMMCSQLWVRVMSVAPSPGSVEAWQGTCAIELTVEIEVGISRCVGIPEGGEAPTATDALEAALQATSDMNLILCTAMDCEQWSSISVGSWTPDGPMGGMYGGVWTFTVTL